MLRGGERFAWDQAAPSQAELAQYDYRVYVDGQARALANVTCAPAPSGDAFACTAPIPALAPGKHTLEITALRAGVESGLSGSVTVTAPAAAVTGRQISATDANGSGCQVSATQSCSSTTILTNTKPISGVVATDDGLVLFIEDGRSVRAVAGNALLRDPMLVAPSSERLVAVLPDGQFSQTGVAFVASIEEQAPGRYALNVTRYRNVAGRFGEPAVVVTQAAPGKDVRALAALDAARHVYIAAQRDSKMLRLTAEGTTPWAQGQASPVLPGGFDETSAIGTDLALRRVVISGRMNDKPWTLRCLTESGGACKGALAVQGSWDARPRSIALVGQPGDAQALLFVDARDRLMQAGLGKDGQLSPLAELTLANLVPLEVTAGRWPSVLVLARSIDASIFTLLRVQLL